MLVSESRIQEGCMEDYFSPDMFQHQLSLARLVAQDTDPRFKTMHRTWLQAGGGALEMDRLMRMRCHKKAGVDIDGIIDRIKQEFLD